MAQNARKKSIYITIWIYIGFIIGAINTILFAKMHFFQKTEYGLTRSLIDIAILLSSFASFGAPVYMLKFYPYYKKRLSKEKNDLLTNGIMIALIGFILVTLIAILARPLIVQKYIENAPLLVDYFYWVLPLAFGFLLFSLLEGYSWNLGLQMNTNILKEVVTRLFVLIIILFYFLKIISLHTFFVLFCFQYILICSFQLVTLIRLKEINFSFKISFVTRKYRKQILALLAFGFSTSMVGAIRIGFDSVVLSSLQGLDKAAQYTFVGFFASIIYAPFRSLIAVYFPLIVNAWKSKNYPEINRIYKRSSINLLVFSFVIFGVIWIGFDAVIDFFNLDEEYKTGKNILLILSIVNIIEMGTGLNAQIIQASTYWRFEFKTNILLGFIIMPFTYGFTKMFGTIGPAYAQLLGIIIYNFIRIIFLYRKHALFPFTSKTILVCILFVVGFLAVYFIESNSILITILKAGLFMGFFLGGNYFLKTSPDMIQMAHHLKQRFKN